MPKSSSLRFTKYVPWFSLIAAAALGAACGDDEGASAVPEPRGGAGGSGGARSVTGGAVNAAGAFAEAGTAHTPGSEGEGGSENGAGASGDGGVANAPPSPDGDQPLFATGGWLTTPDDEYVGYLTVLRDITATGSVDLGRAVEFPGDIVYGSPGDGRVYVVLATEPTIQRFRLDESDELELDGEMGLAQYGVADGVRKAAPVFMALDRAYYFDHGTLQLIVWDPSTMTTSRAISLAELEEEGFGLRTNYLHRDGARLLLSASYFRLTDEEGYAKLNRVAIIDTDTGDVTYADDTRCGGAAFHAVDSSGSLYLASHPGHAAALAVGMAHTEGKSEPAASCLVRIRANASEFDPDYFVDLNELSGGFTGGLMQGAGDQAYVLTYDGPALTPSDYFRATRADAWAVHGITLGDEADTYRRVPRLPLISGYGFAFVAETGSRQTPFIITVSGDFSEGTYYDASDASGFERALTLPGSPGPSIRLR